MDRWRQQIERRLNQIGSMVKGNQSFQADRVSDLVEQIDEIRQDVAKLTDRVDRMAAFLNQQKNGKGEKAE